MRHDDRSKIVAIDLDGVIKLYSTSLMRPFLEKPSTLDESITERKIEDRHEKMNKEPDEPDKPDYDRYIVRMNADQQSNEE